MGSSGKGNAIAYLPLYFTIVVCPRVAMRRFPANDSSKILPAEPNKIPIEERDILDKPRIPYSENYCISEPFVCGRTSRTAPTKA